MIFAFSPSVMTEVEVVPRETGAGAPPLRSAQRGQFGRSHVGLERGDDGPGPDADIDQAGRRGPSAAIRSRMNPSASSRSSSMPTIAMAIVR